VIRAIPVFLKVEAATFRCAHECAQCNNYDKKRTVIFVTMINKSILESVIVTLFSHCCHSVVTLSFICCHTIVTLSLHCCRTVVTCMLDCCYPDVTKAYLRSGATHTHTNTHKHTHTHTHARTHTHTHTHTHNTHVLASGSGFDHFIDH
jgi:hypothetical protein